MLSVKILTMINLMIGYVVGTVQSDNGCACVVTKTAITAPNSSVSVAAGCSSKVDWNNGTSKWCLVDQTSGPCGTLHAGFGYADACINAGFPSLLLTAPVNLEWGQSGYTFYTGQTLVLNWTTRDINSDEWLKLTYIGAGGLRTLTTGSGVNSTAGTFNVRLSDSANSLATNVPLTLATVTSPSVYGLIPNITILQSKITAVSIYDGNRSITTGASITSDDRNLTIVWRSLGQAQVGVATVTVRSSGGGGGSTVGTAVTGIVAQGNMSVNYVLPRTFTGGFGGTTYTAQISVQGTGTGVAPYTGSSVSFVIAVAPTPSRSATPSTTVTPTPTPSLSTGATASNTPTVSLTPSTTPSLSSSITPTVSTTPSLTSTVSLTPTPSQTPAASLDLAAVAAAATAAANANTASIVGGIVATVAAIIIGFVVRRVYERRQIHARRLRKLETSKGTANTVQKMRALYGVSGEENSGTTVMYQVSMPQAQENMRQYASRRGRGV
jgi:hypothetical protein